MSSLTALVKPAPADEDQVVVLNRFQGVTGLKGS